MARSSAYDRRVLPGSIHRPLSDSEILRNPASIAPWIDQLRRDWLVFPDMRDECAAMGKRLQLLQVKAFGARHP